MFMKKIWCLPALIIFAFLLASCYQNIQFLSMDYVIEFDLGEKWEINSSVLFPSEVAYYSMDIDKLFEEQIAEIKDEGLDATWQAHEPDEEGNLPYTILIRGKGMNELEGALSKGMVEQDDSNNNQWIFELDPEDIFMDARSQSFTLKAGRILETNGTQIGRGKVVWTNPTQPMTAVFILPTILDKAISLVIGGMVVFIILTLLGLIIFWQTRPVKLPQFQTISSDPIQINDRCMFCGASMPKEAVFCPSCGNRR